MNTTQTSQGRPSYWLAAIEHNTRSQIRAILHELGFSRREWRILHILSRHPITIDERWQPTAETTTAPGTDATERGNRCANRRSPREILDGLVERELVTVTDTVADLTPAGRELHENAANGVRSVRSSAKAGISDDALATTMATLQTMARNVGWDETQPRLRRHGHGYGRRHGFRPHTK